MKNPPKTDDKFDHRNKCDNIDALPYASKRSQQNVKTHWTLHSNYNKWSAGPVHRRTRGVDHQILEPNNPQVPECFHSKFK